MILDSVKSFEKYKTLVPGFDKVYEFLRKENLLFCQNDCCKEYTPRQSFSSLRARR